MNRVSPRRNVLTLCCCLLLAGIPTVSSATHLWDFEAPEAIETVRVGPTGSVIVTTKSTVLSLDSESGDLQWTSDLQVGSSDLTVFPMTTLAVSAHDSRLTVLDLVLGKKVWDTSALSLKKLHGYHLVPRRGLVLVFGETEGGSDKAMVAVDMFTGAVRWRQDSLLKKKPQDEFFDPRMPPIVDDLGIVLYVSEDGLLKIDAETGEEVWQIKKTKDKSPPVSASGGVPWVWEENRLYLAYDKKQLIAVDISDGSVVWERKKDTPVSDPRRSQGHRQETVQIRQIVLTPQGLLVDGVYGDGFWSNPDLNGPVHADYIDLIDTGSGEPKWKTPIMDHGASRFFKGEDYVLTVRSGDIRAIDLLSGEISDFASPEFKNGERVSGLEQCESGVLATCSQGMAMLTVPGGRETFRVYFRAPERGWLEKTALSVALSVGHTLASDLQYRLETKRMFGTSTPLAAKGPDGKYHEANFLEKMDIYGSVDPALWARFEKRFSATGTSDAYRYIFTDEPGGSVEGLALVKVSKETGEVAGRIPFEDRELSFIMDPVTDTAYVRDGDKGLYAVR